MAIFESLPSSSMGDDDKAPRMYATISLAESASLKFPAMNTFSRGSMG